MSNFETLLDQFPPPGELRNISSSLRSKVDHDGIYGRPYGPIHRARQILERLANYIEDQETKNVQND